MKCGTVAGLALPALLLAAAVRRDGRWQMVAWQSTRRAEP